MGVVVDRVRRLIDDELVSFEPERDVGIKSLYSDRVEKKGKK